jgi:hypothetical protein
MAIASAEEGSVSRLMERPCKTETPQQARMHAYRDDNNIASTIAEEVWHTTIPVLVSLVVHTCRLSSWHDIVSSMSHDMFSPTQVPMSLWTWILQAKSSVYGSMASHASRELKPSLIAHHLSSLV